MNLTAWLTVLSMVVSIISIFISNFLGNKTLIKKISNEQKLKRYNSYYIPFIKAFYKVKPQYWNFYDLRSSTNDEGKPGILEISSLMYNNLEYMGEELPPLVSKFNLIADKRYSQIGVALHSGFVNAPSIEEVSYKVEEVNELFDEIVQKTLLEATQLAKDLSLQPISEPLLSLYLDQKSHRTKLLLKLQEEQIR